MNTYFSNENLNYLQNLILSIFEDKHKIKLNRQSDIELRIIMKGIYNQYGLRTNTKDELHYLNEITINEMYKQIKSGLQQYFHYIDKINNPIHPLNYGQHTRESSKTIKINRT